MPRRPISDEQRQAFRRWFFAQSTPPRQADAAKWFEEQFGHRIHQSTVSESLSKRFSYLDKSTTDAATFRQRAPQWPILEAILYDWYLATERQGGAPTGDLILLKAREIWPRIPQYSHLKPPTFSTGWLEKFKKRHHIRKRIQHGEASSVPETTEEEIRAIQTLCLQYKEEDIYNMDESGLFWRQAPSSGLASNSRPSVKKDKSRITIVTCVNSTGTDRFPLWLIGNAQKPRPLKGVNLQALGCEWRANLSAWMKTEIMVEWLQAFYASIKAERSVLLLMDNLRAHVAGVRLAPPPLNIRIQWLPANSTSIYQPLEQGIIQNLKHHYKKYWLRYMIQQYEAGQNPLASINLYYTVRWLTLAWASDLTNLTIYRCFRKSTVLPSQQSTSLPTEPPLDLEQLFQTAVQVSRIQNTMSLENFLNPEDEDLAPLDSEDVDLEEILQHHVETTVEEEQAEDDGAEHLLPVPTSKEALQAVELLLRYQDHQVIATTGEIQGLLQLERSIRQTLTAQLQQGVLDGWLI